MGGAADSLNMTQQLMQDKIVLVTGATGGIGKQTAIALARMGAQVIVTGRNPATASQAVTEIKRAGDNPNIEYFLADVSNQADLRALVAQFKTKYERLDVLINNAAQAAPKRQLTPGGIEANFAVNVIAPFLLTQLFLDSLQAAQDARVICLMGGDVPAKLDMDNLQAERSFEGLVSYSQSKVAMLAVMCEFAQRMQNTNITINTCYPGHASTNMTRSVTPEMLPRGMRWIFPVYKFLTRPDGDKSAAKASQASVYLASSAEVRGITGKYFNPKSKQVPLPQAALDVTIRQQLWTIVHELTHTPQ